MWCPNCQNEYREGITICPECNTPLLEELNSDDSEKYIPVANVKDEGLKDKICKYLDHVNIANKCEQVIIPAEEEGAEDEEGYLISVPSDMGKEALQVVSTIVKVEAEEKFNDLEVENEAIEELRKINDQKGYIKAGERKENYFSSGLLLTGLGLIVASFGLLNMLEILTIFDSVFSYVMLCAIGVICIAFGILSIVKASRLTSEIQDEEEKEKDLKEFIRNAVTREMLEELNDGETTEELLYLKQTDLIRETLLNQYPDLNGEYADMLIDDYMNEIYND